MGSEKLASSIPDFCVAHDISRATFYNLLRDGLAPETMVIGRRRLITVEAARKWRERMTTMSNPAPTTKAQRVALSRKPARPTVPKPSTPRAPARRPARKPT
jgi:hypothetical protein